MSNLTFSVIKTTLTRNGHGITQATSLIVICLNLKYILSHLHCIFITPKLLLESWKTKLMRRTTSNITQFVTKHETITKYEA